MKTILVPLDLSKTTETVLEASTRLARALDAKLVLAHVIAPALIVDEFSPSLEPLAAAEETTVSDELTHWRDELQKSGLSVETVTLYGPPAHCIRSEAERLAVDYIVVGSHGHGAFYDAVVGSTANQLLRKAPCPVLVVPAGGMKRNAEATAETRAH